MLIIKAQITRAKRIASKRASKRMLHYKDHWHLRTFFNPCFFFFLKHFCNRKQKGVGIGFFFFSFQRAKEPES